MSLPSISIECHPDAGILSSILSFSPCPTSYVCLADASSSLGGICIPTNVVPEPDVFDNIDDIDLGDARDIPTLHLESDTSPRSLQQTSFCNGPPSSDPSGGCGKGMWDEASCSCICIPPYCPNTHASTQYTQWSLNGVSSAGGHDWGSGNSGNGWGTNGGNGACTETWWCNPNNVNPWANCVKGVDCPWWKSPSRGESCFTDQVVPNGIWEIFPTRQACCQSHFPYSTLCNADGDASTSINSLNNNRPSPSQSSQSSPTENPTKYPTIVSPTKDREELEVIPLKFTAAGLPDDVRVRTLKKEMKDVLMRVLTGWGDGTDGLKITSIEEFVPDGTHGKRRAVRGGHSAEPAEPTAATGHKVHRALEKQVTLYYNIYVVAREHTAFGPMLLQQLKESYDDIVRDLRGSTDMQYFGANSQEYRLIWCVSGDNGAFSSCSGDLPVDDMAEEPPASDTFGAPVPLPLDDSNNADGSVSNAGIAVIVLFLLLIVACCGCFFWFRRNPKEKEKFKMTWVKLTDLSHKKNQKSASRSKMSRNADERYRSHPQFHKSRRPSGESSRYEESSRYGDSTVGSTSRVSNAGNRYLMPLDDDVDYKALQHGSRTRSNRNSKQRYIDPSMYLERSQVDPSVYYGGGEGDDPSECTTASGVGMDPSVHHCDKHKLDLEGSKNGNNPVLRITSGEDPPLRPKREPTMYVEGTDAPINSYIDDPPLSPRLDPSVYVEGTFSSDGGSRCSRSSRSSGRSGRTGRSSGASAYKSHAPVSSDGGSDTIGRRHSDVSSCKTRDSSSISYPGYRRKDSCEPDGGLLRQPSSKYMASISKGDESVKSSKRTRRTSSASASVKSQKSNTKISQKSTGGKTSRIGGRKPLYHDNNKEERSQATYYDIDESERTGSTDSSGSSILCQGFRRRDSSDPNGNVMRQKSIVFGKGMAMGEEDEEASVVSERRRGRNSSASGTTGTTRTRSNTKTSKKKKGGSRSGSEKKTIQDWGEEQSCATFGGDDFSQSSIFLKKSNSFQS